MVSLDHHRTVQWVESRHYNPKEINMANSNNQGGNNGNSGNNQGGSKGNNQSGNQGDTSNRGFASMDPEKQREIAAEGGRAAHASGNAHEFTSEEAREAGRMSHKNDGNEQSGGNSGGSRGSQGESSGNRGNSGSSSGGQGGSQQSGGKSGGSGSASSGGNSGSSSGTQGGSREQHAEAGRQSHKNDDKK